MIHVNSQPEPANFDLKVRQPGLAFLKSLNLDLNKPLPPKTKISPYWCNSMDDLHTLYSGICNYLCVFIERVTGGTSTDHFIAKSQKASLAYEWSNYRLACSTMNSRKREYDDVLDPFEIENGWFHIELISGHIYPNPTITDLNVKQQIQDTIKRLGLDNPECRELRARHFDEYRQNLYTADFLHRRSPFVYMEALRQGLL